MSASGSKSIRRSSRSSIRAGKSSGPPRTRTDGSDNRINSDVVLEASTYGLDFGLIAAGVQWIKKKFRNRGKTKDDFEAEKEAARINRTCGALEVMLLEYFRAAQKGLIDEEGMDELLDTLSEMQGYCQSGKLAVPGERDLAEMHKSIANYTAQIAEGKAIQPVHGTEASGANAFALIRKQLLLQKEMLAELD